MSQDTFLEAGRRLKDRYEIIREIGRGLSAVVYKARDLSDQSMVAVKVYPLDSPTAQVVVSRAEGLRVLRVRGMVPVRRVVEENGFLCVAMDLIEGENLATVLHRDGPLNPGRAWSSGPP